MLSLQRKMKLDRVLCSVFFVETYYSHAVLWWASFVTTMFLAQKIQNVPFNHTCSFQATCFNCAANHTSMLHSKLTYKGEAFYISTFTSNGPSNLICAWCCRLIVKLQFQKSDFGFRTKTSAISWLLLRQDLKPFHFPFSQQWSVPINLGTFTSISRVGTFIWPRYNRCTYCSFRSSLQTWGGQHHVKIWEWIWANLYQPLYPEFSHTTLVRVVCWVQYGKKFKGSDFETLLPSTFFMLAWLGALDQKSWSPAQSSTVIMKFL